MEISREERTAFREMAAAFARRAVAPLLKHESPDGELSGVPAVMAEGLAGGLLASPVADAPGFETGIWGRHVLEQGPRVSLMLLTELSQVCGGVAMNFHAAGLAALVMGRAEKSPEQLPERAAVALMEGGFPPGRGTLEDPSQSSPAKIQTIAELKNGRYELTGRKDFVYQAAGTEGYIVFARMDKEWAVFLVPAKAEGVVVEDAGFRMGLRACPLVHLVLSGVKVSEESRLKFSRPVSAVAMEYLRLNWLGNLAIATGVARGGVVSAWEYAAERYQGCTEIVNHPAMLSLFADSEARVMTCEALLDRAASENGRPQNSLCAAAQAKLIGLAAAAQAVTDSLQVFGGYGYMEDYRMEKRYRDVNTLKTAGGGPRELRVLIAELCREDAR